MSITMEEVRKHRTSDDLWIMVHNKVYDITKYLEDHPGGGAVLLEVAGTDATEAFEDIGHSEEAREQLEPFLLGHLPNEEHAETVEVYRPTFEKTSQSAAIDVKENGGAVFLMGSVGLKLGALGLAAAGTVVAYHQGLTTPAVLSAIHTTFRSIQVISKRGDLSTFWFGAALASTAHLSLSLVLGIWASSKLDVQQEFTHYSPHRPAQSAQLMNLQLIQHISPKRPAIDKREWRTFPLTSKVKLSPNVYRLTFALPKEDDILGLPTGQHIALRAVINGKQVSRSYTPISNNSDRGRIELLIKVYTQGLMTRHLECMNIGDEIEIRGPKGAMNYSRKYASQIGMIAGGSGITPMYQLIRAMCEDPQDRTRMVLLYANNTEEDILLRTELDTYAKKNPDRFQVHYVLSSASDPWSGHRGFVTPDLIAKYLPPAEGVNKALLCGPPPMINAMKKILAGEGWTLPGAVARQDDVVFLF